MKYIKFLEQYSDQHPLMEALASDSWMPLDGRWGRLRANDYAAELLDRARRLHRHYVGYEIRWGYDGRIFDSFSVVAGW